MSVLIAKPSREQHKYTNAYFVMSRRVLVSFQCPSEDGAHIAKHMLLTLEGIVRKPSLRKLVGSGALGFKIGRGLAEAIVSGPACMHTQNEHPIDNTLQTNQRTHTAPSGHRSE